MSSHRPTAVLFAVSLMSRLRLAPLRSMLIQNRARSDHPRSVRIPLRRSKVL